MAEKKRLVVNAPYREEKTPSFKVNTDRNIWFDFGLGRGDDIFTLAGELIRSMDFLAQARYISDTAAGCTRSGRPAATRSGKGVRACIP